MWDTGTRSRIRRARPSLSGNSGRNNCVGSMRDSKLDVALPGRNVNVFKYRLQYCGSIHGKKLKCH